MKVKEHLQLLGKRVVDRVTRFEGVVISISFDLFGCVQALVDPGVDADQKIKDRYWFDMNRLSIITKEPVMEVPDFDYGPIAEGKRGPADKPTKF